MAEATASGALQPQRTEPRIDGPFISFDVPLEIARLRAAGAHEREHHAGRTLTKYPDLRVVLETMQRGARLPFHETAERMTLHVVVGQLRVRLEHGESCDLAEGSFTAIDAARVHELECLEECAFLLTLAWPRAARRGEADVVEPSGDGI